MIGETGLGKIIYQPNPALRLSFFLQLRFGETVVGSLCAPIFTPPFFLQAQLSGGM